ncbi:MAG TPA: methionine ABC transporter substrate-binding protein [Clostridiales bacterium UBA8960]|nr:methionine ABC transporter substrate-binding protein [Clostridiales bacterium UBA8960]
MTKKITAFTLVLVLSILTLIGCGAKEESGTVLKVGATPVPHSELLELVKSDLLAEGITLEIVEFTDYVTPNLALNDGEISANFFQHVPYMTSFSAEHKLDLVSAGTVHVEPLGLYSNTFEDIASIPVGAVIAIPNDPTNEGRALLLLQSAGLIKLKAGVSLEATDADIIDNPLGLVFKPIDASQLPRTLDDVDGAVINTNYALEANLNPVEDAVILEGADSPYANIVTVRSADLNSDAIKKLVAALQSEKVKKFIEEKYGGAVVPAF